MKNIGTYNHLVIPPLSLTLLTITQSEKLFVLSPITATLTDFKAVVIWSRIH
jgi:hypothetical protein